MKAVVCEMCGGNEVVKQGEFFVCQSCGTKYETEAARKLLVEVDSSARLANLYTLARRAREEDDAEGASRYYSQILEEEPNDWEAHFFNAYYANVRFKIGELPSASSRFLGAVKNSFLLLNDSDLPAEEIAENAALMADYALKIAERHFSNASYDHVNCGNISARIGRENESSYRSVVENCFNTCLVVGNALESLVLSGVVSENDANLLKAKMLTVWKYPFDALDGLFSGSSSHGAKSTRRFLSDFTWTTGKRQCLESIRRYEPDYPVSKKKRFFSRS